MMHTFLAWVVLAVLVGRIEVKAWAQEESEAQDVEAQAADAQVAVDEASAPPVVPVKARNAPAGGKVGLAHPDFIADGSRVTVRDGDFSLKPPKGWEVFTKLDSLTLLMQIPKQQGMRYQRTIQVASFSEPRFIDEMTAKEYEAVIVQKFSAVSSAIEDYRVRNHMNIDLVDGRSALLFYTEFKLEGVDLMQAHILVSSAERHYLMTYTDIAEHFEGDEANQFLTEAWESMTSVELSTDTPRRFETFAAMGVALIALVLAGGGVIAFRAWKSGRNYRMYSEGRGLEDEDLTGEVEGEPKSRNDDPQSLASSDPPTSLNSGSDHGMDKDEDVAV